MTWTGILPKSKEMKLVDYIVFVLLVRWNLNYFPLTGYLNKCSNKKCIACKRIHFPMQMNSFIVLNNPQRILWNNVIISSFDIFWSHRRLVLNTFFVWDLLFSLTFSLKYDVMLCVYVRHLYIVIIRKIKVWKLFFIFVFINSYCTVSKLDCVSTYFDLNRHWNDWFIWYSLKYCTFALWRIDF